MGALDWVAGVLCEEGFDMQRGREYNIMECCSIIWNVLSRRVF